MPAQISKFGCWVSAVLCVLASLCHAAATREAATGSMEFDCHPPLFLNLNLKGLPNDETLSLYFLWEEVTREGIVGKERLSVGGKWCPAGGYRQCEPVKTTVEFRKFNLDKKASGTYVVEFSDGRKLEGSFSVVRKKQPKPFLCE